MHGHRLANSGTALRPLLGALCTALAAACSDSSGITTQMTVTGVSPNNGPLAGGTMVTIAGVNFLTAIDSVRMGSSRLSSVVRVSPTEITGTTPANQFAERVDVTVHTTSRGNATCSACFTYNPPVSVTGVTPSSGALLGGTAVTITGANFPEVVDSVLVGNRRLGNLVRASASQLTGITPASSTLGPVDIVVLTAGAGSDTCAHCFTYLDVPPDLRAAYCFTAYFSGQPYFSGNVTIETQVGAEFSGTYTPTEALGRTITGDALPLAGTSSGAAVTFTVQGQPPMFCTGTYSSGNVAGTWWMQYDPTVHGLPTSGTFTLIR